MRIEINKSSFENPMGSIARIWLPHLSGYDKGGEILECPGWKVAYLVEVLPTTFKGLNSGGYSMSDKAICQKNKKHISPHVECDCGFYSFNNVRDAKHQLSMNRNLLLLYTENYGEIYLHSRGAKSQEQDVIEIYIPDLCSRYFCKNEAIGLSKFKKYWAASCNQHKSNDYYSHAQLKDILLVDVSKLSNLDN